MVRVNFVWSGCSCVTVNKIKAEKPEAHLLLRLKTTHFPHTLYTLDPNAKQRHLSLQGIQSANSLWLRLSQSGEPFSPGGLSPARSTRRLIWRTVCHNDNKVNSIGLTNNRDFFFFFALLSPPPTARRTAASDAWADLHANEQKHSKRANEYEWKANLSGTRLLLIPRLLLPPIPPLRSPPTASPC